MNPITPPGLTSAQRNVILKARRQHGTHFMFAVPHDVSKHGLNFVFPSGFVAKSALSLVVVVEANQPMEIQYESKTHENKYVYVTRKPSGELVIGTKDLVYKVHHRYDLELTAKHIMSPGVHIITLELDSYSRFQVSMDGGKGMIKAQVKGTDMAVCGRVRHGFPYFDDPKSEALKKFKVYELHHASNDPKVLFEQIGDGKGASYTLPPFVFVAAGGEIIFGGKFHPRSAPTDRIPVYYGGKQAAGLRGAPLDSQSWVVFKFYTTFFTIYVANTNESPTVIKRDAVSKTAGDTETHVSAITVSRNFQVNNVHVYTGLTQSPVPK
ncbi:uncharacterized protein LOC144135058 [Amblyomma americanum]